MSAHKNLHSLATNPLDQVKTSKLELYENNMEEELEEHNMLKEELVTVKSQECRQGKFRSSDGHTYRVECDAAKKYVTFLFNKEEQPITHEIDRRANKAAKRARQRSVVEEELDEFYMPKDMKPSTFQSTDDNNFKVEMIFANKQVNCKFGAEEQATNDVAKHIKKAAKRARERSAKYGTTAMVKDNWKLECTYTGCSAGEEGAPFKTPALAPADALARLGLHRESVHGKHRDDAGVDAERIHRPNQPSPEVEHVLQPAEQPSDKQQPAKHSAAATKINYDLAPRTKPPRIRG
jgi:hypothetical protein